MRTTRKVLLALVLTLCVAAVLSVCAFAALDFETDLPTGVTKDEDGWIPSEYEDVDTEEGWYMIGINNKDSKVANGQFPKLTYLENARFYWNKTTGEAVWLILTTMSGNSGMTTVIDPRQMDEHSSGRQSLYKYACIFVDIAERAGAATENPNGNASNMQTKYPVWYRYTTTMDPAANKPLASTGQWGNITVTATQYEQYTAKRAELVASGYADERLQDALVEYVNVTFTGLSVAQNCLFDGAFYSTAWVFNQLSNNGYAFNVVEFRRKKSTTVDTFGTAGLVTQLFEAKTVLMDSRIIGLNLTNTSRALLMNNAALTTFDHVEYADYTGNYDKRTVVSGVVDLSGFKVFTPHTNDGKSAEYAFSHILAGCTGMTKVVWFDSIISNGDISSKYSSAVIKVGDDEAGRIDSYNLDGCTSLEEVTLTAPLTAIRSYALRNCKALKKIYLLGGVAEGATVDSNSFTGVSGTIDVYIYTKDDVDRAKAAFETVTNVQFNYVLTLDPEEDALVADGYSIRVTDANAAFPGPALRAEFTLSAAKVAEAWEEKGLSLDDYGVVIFSEKTFKTLYNESVEAIMAAVLAEERPDKIIRRSAFNGPYVKKNENGDKTFAAAITGIDETNYDSAVYTYAYAKWTDGTNVKYTYTTYTSSRTHKTAHSLYDATVFAFSTGVVNSQNFKMTAIGDEEKAVELWDILEKGAFTITKDDITTPNENLQIKYDLDNDTFTYLNEPLRAWKFNKYDTWSPYNPSWDAYGNYVEEESTTNVLWSILRDGDDLIVAYRRDPDAEANATAFIPTILEGKLASAPYCSEYFDGIELVWEGGKQVPKERFIDTAGGNGIVKGSYVYTPIVSESVEEKITTLVIDYGITNFKYRALGNSKTPSLTKIIYPENVAASSGLLAGNNYIESFIYAPVGIHQLPTETWEEGFGPVADLSGLKSFSFASAFDGCYKIQNLLLPQMTKNSNDIQTTFNGMRALKRAWTFGSPVPNEGTLDFSKTRITTICKRSFADFQMSKTMDLTVIMPEAFTGIAAYSLKISEQEACSEVLGKDLAYTIDLGENVAALTNSTKGLLLYYERMLEANNDLDNNGTLGSKANYKGTGDVVYLVYELKDAQADNMNKIMITCKVNGVKQTLSFADWRTYCIDNDLYETTLAE